MHIDYPFRIDGLGRTATTPDEAYLVRLIEQVLLTAPGERVNRPDFGCGVRGRVFNPNQEEQAAALEFAIEAALSRFLGGLVVIEKLTVDAEDSTLRVQLQYQLPRSQERREITVPKRLP
jgi:uncharacterized protein